MFAAHVTILDGNIDLLPYFVKHYRKLGASSFRVLVYDKPNNVENVHREARRIIGSGYEWLGEFDEKIFNATHRDLYLAEKHNGQYAFFCDLDEFAEITLEHLQRFVASKKPFIWGRWIDRVSATGKLIDVDSSLTLDEQFPNKTAKPMLKVLGIGGPVFVFGNKAPSRHHPNVCERCKNKLYRSTCIRVHHFKWQGNVASRLAERRRRILADISEDRPHVQWLGRVNRTLNYIADNNGLPKRLLTPCKKLIGV